MASQHLEFVDKLMRIRSFLGVLSLTTTLVALFQPILGEYP